MLSPNLNTIYMAWCERLANCSVSSPLCVILFDFQKSWHLTKNERKDKGNSPLSQAVLSTFNHNWLSSSQQRVSLLPLLVTAFYFTEDPAFHCVVMSVSLNPIYGNILHVTNIQCDLKTHFSFCGSTACFVSTGNLNCPKHLAPSRLTS